MKTKVGLIGLGIMGRAMAKNLIKAGFPLVVWNRTPSRTEEFVANGVPVANSPRELASQAEVIISVVSDSADVGEVLLGKDGVIDGIRGGSVVIDMSTISPSATRDMCARFQEKNVAMLDAPVSGGEKGAIEATLSIMVGGDAAALERVRPVLEALGKTITHIGPSGMGQTCKLANQVAVGIHNLAMSEALVFAAKAGADVSKVLQALQGGAGASWALTNLAPKILKRDFSPGFMVALQQKDLRLVLEAAEKMQLPLPGTLLTKELYDVVEADGASREGNHALVKAIEKLGGAEVRQP